MLDSVHVDESLARLAQHLPGHVSLDDEGLEKLPWNLFVPRRRLAWDLSVQLRVMTAGGLVKSSRVLVPSWGGDGNVTDFSARFLLPGFAALASRFDVGELTGNEKASDLLGETKPPFLARYYCRGCR